MSSHGEILMNFDRLCITLSDADDQGLMPDPDGFYDRMVKVRDDLLDGEPNLNSILHHIFATPAGETNYVEMNFVVLLGSRGQLRAFCKAHDPNGDFDECDRFTLAGIISDWAAEVQ